jgi:hypothetical protein
VKNEEFAAAVVLNFEFIIFELTQSVWPLFEMKNEE